MWDIRTSSCTAATLCCVFASAAGAAVDVGVAGRKLVIIDGGANSRSKVVFVAKGDAIGKGGGTDAAGISASLQISRGDESGGFAVPIGAYAGGSGWRANEIGRAQYLNRAAPSSAPTGVRSLVLKAGRTLRVMANSLGDESLDFAAVAASTTGIEVVATIRNGSATHRLCTRFPASEVRISGPNSAGRSKLTARRGVSVSCPGIELAPLPALPAPPPAPYLWFDGTDAAALADLAARVGDGATSGFFTSFRGVAGGSLARTKHSVFGAIRWMIGSIIQWMAGRSVKRTTSRRPPVRVTAVSPSRTNSRSIARGMGVGATVWKTSFPSTAFLSKFFSTMKISAPQYVAAGKSTLSSKCFRPSPERTNPCTRPSGTSMYQSRISPPSTSRMIDRPRTPSRVPSTTRATA